MYRYNVERVVSSIMILGKVDSSVQKKKKNGPQFYIIHKNELEWIKDTNLRSETIKLLEENIVDKLFDVGLGDAFKILIPKTKATKAKINK